MRRDERARLGGGFWSDEEIRRPWSTAWLPIVANGGGDFVVYGLRGKHAGTLILYCHDAAQADRGE